MKPFSRFSRLNLLLLIFLVSGFCASNAQMRIELVEDESQLWIEGSSNVNDIYCEARELIGYANIEQTNIREDFVNGNLSESFGASSNDNVSISIPVYEFDCGRRVMNRDFYRALKADEHPSIEFRYHSARLITSLDPECHPFQLEVDGVLTVAGAENEVTILVNIEPCELNMFRLTGSKVINMKDFGITPPSAMFGLIKAREELEVFFSLTAKQQQIQP